MSTFKSPRTSQTSAQMSSGVSKKRATETVSFLNITNPEIFQIQPRPGGVVPIQDDDSSPVVKRSVKKGEEESKELVKDSKQIEEKISRDFRIHTALDEVSSIDSQETTLPNPLRDAMYMIGVTLSCLIMMASEAQLSNENIEWTKNCLNSIRDEYDTHPPNIQLILNHIKHLNEKSASPEAASAAPEASAPEASALEASALEASAPEGAPQPDAEGAEGATADTNATDENKEGETPDENGGTTVRSKTRVRMGSRGSADQ